MAGAAPQLFHHRQSQHLKSVSTPSGEDEVHCVAKNSHFVTVCNFVKSQPIFKIFALR